MIELDFQTVYGIDIGDGVLKRRTWRWMRQRVIGLLSVESRLQRVLNPQDTNPKPGH